MTRKECVRRILGEFNAQPQHDSATAWAPANIALCKYWGKRNSELYLPQTSSLSVSLGDLGTQTTLSIASDCDMVVLNGHKVEPENAFARRLSAYLDLFRGDKPIFFHIDTANTVPTAAGLASSASGFAALVLALQSLYGWSLDGCHLSILARLGSGSACRSIYHGFVEWQAGIADDGFDSYAEPLPETWPDLRVGILTLSTAEKPIGSRQAMQHTLETSTLYRAWPQQVESDLPLLRRAIAERDLHLLGQTAENNALAMHATLLAARPAILYWLPESVQSIRTIHDLRKQGAAVYLTMDAGPNVKLLFEKNDVECIRERFPKVAIVSPFA
ncbi:diphosphomevalonate decarboxylase [candidate division KSB1 bacterium]|nr:diphosphomevalonate decarboxylase [candidate division KSB1 bacterium]